MFGLGTTELLVIGGIIVLIFGAKRLPEIGKGLGGAIKEFRNVRREISPDDQDTKAGQGGEQGKNSLEEKLVEKVVEEVPVVKKGLAAKKKADKITKIIS
jgi:sec-independent protein translocase protein TatA